MSLITEGRVVLDRAAPDRHTATRLLAERLVASGRCTDAEAFVADVRAREEKMATGLPGGIGIPHARSAAITAPSLVFGRSTEGVDWGAKDGPATLIFLIAAPEGGGDVHMQMLPKLARALMKKEFKAALMGATTPAEVVDIVNAEVALHGDVVAPSASEGAIPFAAADPVPIIASSVVGSAITGALAMGFGATLRAPHGGIWVLPLIGNFVLYLVALAVGVAVMARIVVFLKSRTGAADAALAADATA